MKSNDFIKETFNFINTVLEKMPAEKFIFNDVIAYLRVLISSNELFSFDKKTQIKIYEKICDIIIFNRIEHHHTNLLEDTETNLIKLYNKVGSFTECITTSEHLFMLSKSEDIKQFAFMSLVEASIASGDIRLEKRLLSSLSNKETLVGNENVWFYLARFFSKTDGTQSLEFIEKLIIVSKKVNDIELRFKLLQQVVTNYFYLGKVEKALRLVDIIKTEFDNYLSQNRLAKIYLEHNIVVLMHNIDKNEYVVNGNLFIKAGYKEFNDVYNYLMTRVNLADGYMGIGALAESEKELKETYFETLKTSGLNSTDIAAICYANTLSCRGKTSEALHYYEEGIKLSKQIGHYWDCHYGQIWRALALADFGDYSSIDILYNLISECENKEFDYLANLASCFYVLSMWILNHSYSQEKALYAYNKINAIETPGLKAQALASLTLLFDFEQSKKSEMLIELCNYCLSCEGIKGRPQVVYEAFKKEPGLLKDKNIVSEMNKWLEKYISPVLEDIKNVENYYFDELSTRPLLSGCNMKTCPGFCCYDGAYLQNDDEEQRIKQFVTENSRYFKHLPKNYIIDGNWRNIVKGRKTAVRNFEYTSSVYPKHFENTRCVFCLDNNYCSLQKTAVELGLHPWKTKPTACWMFPISSFIEGVSIAPPTKDEKDPNYVDETYPGYVKFLPCGMEKENGKLWYEVYKHEIIYGGFKK